MYEGSGWFLLATHGDDVFEPIPCFGGQVVLKGGTAQFSIGGRTRSLPTRTAYGAIFGWYHPRGESPTWQLHEADPTGFSGVSYFSMDFHTHPRLIMRDLVDYAHFRGVHGYRELELERPFATDGVRANVRMRCIRDQPLPLGRLPMRIVFDCTCYGLGFQIAEVMAIGGMLKTRHLVCPTPIDATRTRVTLGVAAAFWMSAAFDRRGALAGPLRWLSPVLKPYLSAQYRRDVLMDAGLWQALASAEPVAEDDDPRLVEYHAWADQFSPSPPTGALRSAS